MFSLPNPSTILSRFTARKPNAYSNLEAVPPMYTEFPTSPQPPQYVAPTTTRPWTTSRTAARTQTKASWEPSRAGKNIGTAAIGSVGVAAAPAFGRKFSFGFGLNKRSSGEDEENLIAGPEYNSDDYGRGGI